MTKSDKRLAEIRERINLRLSVYRDKLKDAAELHEHTMRNISKYGTHATGTGVATQAVLERAFYYCEALEGVLQLFDDAHA